MFIVVHPVDPVRYGHAVDRPFGGMPSRLLSRDRSGLFDDADRWHTGWHGRQRLKIFFLVHSKGYFEMGSNKNHISFFG